MQLDIFEHSQDVMLRNDVLRALEQHDAPRARAACTALQTERALDAALPDLLLLTEALEARVTTTQGAWADHDALRRARLALQDRLEPVALRVWGAAAAVPWLRPFWQDLVFRARQLPFRAEAEQDHVAPMLLQTGDWQGALEAVASIESWRRIPAPLTWMTQAKLRLYGLQASWALLAELAWLSPRRLEALVQGAQEPLLRQLKDQFEAALDPMDATTDLAWFPAWVLTEKPQFVAFLAPAQASQHSAPEQAMRLLVNLLGLERQGRQRELVRQRKELRELNPWLYGAYMRTR